jgi:hypothetical protein
MSLDVQGHWDVLPVATGLNSHVTLYRTGAFATMRRVAVLLLFIEVYGATGTPTRVLRDVDSKRMRGGGADRTVDDAERTSTPSKGAAAALGLNSLRSSRARNPFRQRATDCAYAVDLHTSTEHQWVGASPLLANAAAERLRVLPTFVPGSSAHPLVLQVGGSHTATVGTPWTMCRTSALQRAGVSPAALSASVRRVSTPGPGLECVAAAVPGTVLTALWRNGTFAEVADPAKGPYWEDALGCAASTTCKVDSWLPPSELLHWIKWCARVVDAGDYPISVWMRQPCARTGSQATGETFTRSRTPRNCIRRLVCIHASRPHHRGLLPHAAA